MWEWTAFEEHYGPAERSQDAKIVVLARSLRQLGYDALTGLSLQKPHPPA
jgi:hypothetical protein